MTAHAPPYRPPRWKCLYPRCPKRRWQTVTAWGEYDPVDVALGEFEAHWQREHRTSDEVAKQEGTR